VQKQKEWMIELMTSIAESDRMDACRNLKV
jgi:hypothetical protein